MILANPTRYKVLFMNGTKAKRVKATSFDVEQPQGGISWVVFYQRYSDSPNTDEVARFSEISIKGIMVLPHHKRKGKGK